MELWHNPWRNSWLINNSKGKEDHINRAGFYLHRRTSLHLTSSLSVCPWVWRPEIKIRSLLQLLSTLFIYFSVTPAFTSLGRLSSQWAPENLLSLPTKRQDYRCVPQSWRLAWVLGIGFRSSCVLSINYFMVWTTFTLSQPPAQHFILKGENTIFNLLFYAHVEVRTQLLVVRSPWDPGIKTQVTKFVQKMCSPAAPSSCKCII